MKMVKTILVLSLVAIMSNVAMAANYTVGGSDGWDQLTDLASWASSISFVEGDILIFGYTPNHDVVEVSEADFSSCSDSNPLQPRGTGGLTTVPLTSAGTRYFICSNHCLNGMKVQITTLAASAPPPSTTPSPPPTPSARPPSPKTASPSPSPKHPLAPKISPTAPPPSATLTPPPPPSSAARVDVMGALTGFAMIVMSFNL